VKKKLFKKEYITCVKPEFKLFSSNNSLFLSSNNPILPEKVPRAKIPE
jgi:hypothetical protein